MAKNKFFSSKKEKKKESERRLCYIDLKFALDQTLREAEKNYNEKNKKKKKT